ncbi:MAG: hypothetical protein VYB80_01195, partial [Actinomycetota bacterium]|nr:hypothetical protein [Actinomycetota bacterium]
MRFKALTEFVSKEIIDSFKVIWDHLGQPGSWWTGPQRIAIAEHVRRSAPRPLWDKAPRLETLSDATEGELSNFEMGV